jgi:hypothetical protein
LVLQSKPAPPFWASAQHGFSAGIEGGTKLNFRKGPNQSTEIRWASSYRMAVKQI